MLTELYFMVDVIAQCATIAVLAYNAGSLFYPNDASSDRGLAVGIIFVIGGVFVLTTLWRLCLARFTNLSLGPLTGLQSVCATYCSFSTTCDRKETLVLLLAQSVFQVAISAQYIGIGRHPPSERSNFTFSDAFCVSVLGLVGAKLFLYITWIGPVMFNAETFLFCIPSWAALFTRKLKYLPRQRRLSLGYFWALFALFAAGAIGYGLILGFTGTISQSICDNLSSSQVFILCNVARINSYFNITQNCHTNLLSVVTNVHGDLSIYNVTRESDIQLSIFWMAGSLYILHNLQLTSVTFADLIVISSDIDTSNLVIDSNPALTSMDFTLLAEIDGALYITNNSALTAAQFPQLTFMSAEFSVIQNGALTLIDLSSLTYLGNWLEIKNNNALILLEVWMLETVDGSPLQICANGNGTFALKCGFCLYYVHTDHALQRSMCRAI